LQRNGNAAADRAIAAIVHGREKRIDLGEVDGRPFVGAFAVGMDADILHTRNRLRRRFRFGRKIGGYPLYIWSCAVNLLRTHGGAAELTLKGSTHKARFYNFLITNTPIYAGEFRFVDEDTADDGWLDLHLFTDATDYLRRYPAAWRRHVRHERGLEVAEPAVERVQDIVLETDQPMSAQLDGEELAAASCFVVRVLPAQLAVKVPVPAALCGSTSPLLQARSCVR
jgi:diacylglycerol kinase family enzyme